MAPKRNTQLAKLTCALRDHVENGEGEAKRKAETATVEPKKRAKSAAKAKAAPAPTSDPPDFAVSWDNFDKVRELYGLDAHECQHVLSSVLGPDPRGVDFWTNYKARVSREEAMRADFQAQKELALREQEKRLLAEQEALRKETEEHAKKLLAEQDAARFEAEVEELLCDSEQEDAADAADVEQVEQECEETEEEVDEGDTILSENAQVTGTPVDMAETQVQDTASTLLYPQPNSKTPQMSSHQSLPAVPKATPVEAGPQPFCCLKHMMLRVVNLLSVSVDQLMEALPSQPAAPGLRSQLCPGFICIVSVVAAPPQTCAFCFMLLLSVVVSGLVRPLCWGQRICQGKRRDRMVVWIWKLSLPHNPRSLAHTWFYLVLHIHSYVTLFCNGLCM